MATPQDPQLYIHRAAVDAEGSRIGKISQVYLDAKTGQPLWVLVETGLFGIRDSFAPIHGSRFDGELVVLAVSKEQVKGAPNIGRGEQLSESEQDGLHRYYRDYLDTAAETRGYEKSQHASKWDSGQEPAFRRTEK
jgi:PRC-barrel domain protein